MDWMWNLKILQDFITLEWASSTVDSKGPVSGQDPPPTPSSWTQVWIHLHIQHTAPGPSLARQTSKAPGLRSETGVWAQLLPSERTCISWVLQRRLSSSPGAWAWKDTKMDPPRSFLPEERDQGLELPGTTAWSLRKKPAQKKALGINPSDIMWVPNPACLWMLVITHQ